MKELIIVQLYLSNSPPAPFLLSFFSCLIISVSENDFSAILFLLLSVRCFYQDVTMPKVPVKVLKLLEYWLHSLMIAVDISLPIKRKPLKNELDI